jgi:hypothetical protein
MAMAETRMPLSASIAAPPRKTGPPRASQPERRKRDQDDLEQGGQRLGLAMAEAVVVIVGHGRDPHPSRVARLATRSSAVSARLPSMASEPVAPRPSP